MHTRAVKLVFLYLLVASTAAKKTLDSDIRALVAFKAAIDSASIPSWSCLASWDFSSVDPCDTPRRTHFICGITCDNSTTSSAARVTALALDSAGYAGPITPRLADLTALTLLDLSSNSFRGPIPPSLASLPSLTTLALSTNSLSGPLPPSLPNLTSLQSLDLSQNQFRGRIPIALHLMSSLNHLDLSFNALSGALPDLPSNLVVLAVKGNLLTGALFRRVFSSLEHLAVLELSDNQLNGKLGGWLFALPALQQINLSNNKLSALEVWKSSTLVAVDLSYNRLQGLLPTNFSLLPLLAALSLRHNQFWGPLPREYGQMVAEGRVRRMYLDSNFLQGNVPPAFFKFSGTLTGSVGDNCLRNCPPTLSFCMPPQKSAASYRQRLLAL
ncbi:probable LRR receptor-like serine/threonine-protein kinase At4g36180 [Amborella trichopoda]|uniref:Leucine-rich repeat-containing N-terminal plant-type domain-containing protein n=1 Tax=Amborella trichopoda TaxID=13333 RepID=U5D5H3_AMBTC|nr:probable LRR receptor-like serine/threonine-protein kinase At4g36180 [Amborella trichopoda]ERN16672.1 hypothetical protein AMTR_s00051p00180000 [Amborella trichopoda]|eukprot:XP_006855205.1 probable LRR receptor-like serine/threonine-protein kinase At4g36180 [Amborella trichopoda]